ncbi:ribosome small subunit-dependent GTPase A [Nitrosophilus kaiyonis]|uniref:ribosome small subunit-dependent GTPase A n=1 Tax=Nitrosophilus kaiyonis TaxID=2930200 RepID=UPI002490AC20|nr:ribosome small subunit-dependent GTPase A [Nitrosophilus kaiyonis]
MSVKGLVTYRSAAASRVTIFDSFKIYPSIIRKKLKKLKLYAGDFVEGEIVDDKFVIEKIYERKNLLTRPPVANVDNVLIVVAIKNPDFDNYLLDNFLAVYEYKQIEPVIIFNKIDLLSDKSELKKWMEIYKKIGYETHALSAKENSAIEKIKDYIKGQISILAGPSGVGKSTILSKILDIPIKTKDISNKLKRGRHTTTAVTLYRFNENSFIADTPGFSKVEATYFMEKKDVRLYFREFLNYSCKFPDCTHTSEPGCKVKEAVLKGEISCERFKSYLKIMNYFWEELPC